MDFSYLKIIQGVVPNLKLVNFNKYIKIKFPLPRKHSGQEGQGFYETKN